MPDASLERKYAPLLTVIVAPARLEAVPQSVIVPDSSPFGGAVQAGYLKLPTRVSQPAVELAWLATVAYSFVYQNVQSSVGSTCIAL